MLNEYKDYLNTKQVCEILGISKSALLRYLKEGIIPGVKIGKKRIWRIKKKDVIDYMDQG